MTDHATDHDHAAFLPPLLALDALVHASVLDQAIEAAAFHAAVTDTSTVFDIGAGTGTGTFALAAKYPTAQVLAIDVDADMLATVRSRAEHEQMGDRIGTAHLDVGDAGFDVGPADMIWSSNALHEVPDAAAAFGNMFRSLRRGGVLVVLEMESPPSVLPTEHQLLENALRAAAGADGPGPDWSSDIRTAGFDIVETRSVTSDQLLPADGPGGEYAVLELRRLLHHARPALTEKASAEIRALVTDLSRGHQLLTNVHIRGARTLWVARRP